MQAHVIRVPKPLGKLLLFATGGGRAKGKARVPQEAETAAKKEETPPGEF